MEEKIEKKQEQQPMSAKRSMHLWGIGVVIVAVLLSFAAAFVGNRLADDTHMANIQTSMFGGVTNDGNKVVTKEEASITSVVEKVSPSVVSILTSTSTSQSRAKGYTYEGAGTGMIVSKDGYIMTNKHVIDGSRSATVVLSDGKTYKDVPVLGSDPLNDVAFLKIPRVNDLTPISIGDSKTVRTGQRVIAIGNALGQYQNTVTEGIISGKGRPVSAQSETGSVEDLADLFQTDAAINSGNSGGPLLNIQGQVIGINTAVAADAQSVGFAIPIGATKGILHHLTETGKVERAVVGVQYVSITPEVKEEYKLSTAKGDYVTAVSGVAVKQGGPAEEAGVKAKDIIVKVNSQEVGPGMSTSTLVGEFQPGDIVTLTLLRGSKTVDVKVTLAAY